MYNPAANSHIEISLSEPTNQITTMAISQKLTPNFSKKMPKPPLHSFNTIFLVLLLFLMKMCPGMSVLDLNSGHTSELERMVKRVCSGKISECSEMAVEEEMDSENNKRMLLMQRKFISYDTLKRDMVPCTTPGASYYNCRGAGPANSYSRGCEMITRCDRGG